MERVMLVLSCLAMFAACSSTSVTVDGGQGDGQRTDQGLEQTAPDRDLQADKTTDANNDSRPDGQKPAACPSDALGNNQSQKSAYSLQLADHDLPDLVVCAGFDDWATIELPYGKAMQFEVCHKAGDPEVELDFFREEFPEPQYFYGGGSSSSEHSCTNTTLVEAAGRYFFRAFTTATQAPYWIQLYYADQQPLPCANEGAACSSSETCKGGQCLCNTDSFEPNDDDTEARDLPLGEQHSLTNCIADDDWFRVTIEKSATMQIDVEVYSGVGHEMDVTVFSPDSVSDPLAYFPQAKNYNDSFSLAVQPGELLLRVRNTNSGSRNYELTVTLK